MKTKVLPPDPARLIEGLRDTGYQFHTALADVVDNSIAAMAGAIEVEIHMDLRGRVRVCIADDGCGMTEQDLENAMKYGSRNRLEAFSLGKFGLGLKTASTAFCRLLSVVTRAEPGGKPSKASWDLDHVAEVGEWELLLPEPTHEDIELLERVTNGGSGTVVLWEKVDRVLKDYSDPGGKAASRALDAETEHFRAHAAMVYQRFLCPTDERARNLSISVNGRSLKAWDPFCTTEEETQLVADSQVPVELPSGDEVDFAIRAFTLPRRGAFSSSSAEKAARIGNDTQGLYIYRENRLIHHGDWLRMFRREPHYSLLRVEFSFDHRLDEAFQIDIKKSQVILNEVLYDWIRDEFLPAPRRAAAELYRKGQQAVVSEAGRDAHTASNRNIEVQESRVTLAHVTSQAASRGEVEVTNPKGTFRIKAPIVAPIRPGECFVQASESLGDGLLWEPCVIDGHVAVRINTGHPYYAKVYMPNLASGVTVQGMDSLLWAFCQAEWGTISDQTSEHSRELRYEISRTLRSLVALLPDPTVEDDDGG